MNGFDIAVAVSAVASFVGGYRKGLLARLLTWVCMALGLFLVSSNMAAAVKLLGNPPRNRRLLTMAFALFLGLVAGRLIGYFFGNWVQGRIPTRPLRSVNRVLGGMLGIAGVLGTAWLALPLMAQIPGWPSTTARSSLAAKTLHKKMPDPPNAFGSVRRLVSGGEFPLVLGTLERALDVGSVPTLVDLAPEVLDAAALNSMRVTSTSCGITTEASGFGVGTNRMITAAHVVSGSSEIKVNLDDGTIFPAQVVAIDAIRDVAILSVEGWAAPPFEFGNPDTGTKAAILGHRNGGPLQLVAAGISEPISVDGRDIYDEKRVRRDVLVLASRMAPGDAGAALVDADGKILGMTFSVAPDRPTTAYAIGAGELEKFITDVDAGTRGKLPGGCIAK
jgi:S1-C subfamily serine protease